MKDKKDYIQEGKNWAVREKKRKEFEKLYCYHHPVYNLCKSNSTPVNVLIFMFVIGFIILPLGGSGWLIPFFGLIFGAFEYFMVKKPFYEELNYYMEDIKRGDELLAKVKKK